MGQEVVFNMFYRVGEQTLGREMYRRADTPGLWFRKQFVFMRQYTIARLVSGFLLPLNNICPKNNGQLVFRRRGLLCLIPCPLLADRYGRRRRSWPNVFYIHLIWAAPLWYFVGGPD
ncbi:kinase-like domain [Cordyceps militaris]|uniref:Kinase-like domain n=1 Tax=Cordyceps militaris TaxID=73501 RepID=A0A2H4ST95_CORMI|nr:kinase-like domain [Cordyceps militaris]